MVNLDVVKNIADNYSGSVMVESNPVNGTTFQISLPKEQSDERSIKTV